MNYYYRLSLEHSDTFCPCSFRVYGCKTWQEIAVYSNHTAKATGVRFGQNAAFLASTSLDRSLKIYGDERYS